MIRRFQLEKLKGEVPFMPEIMEIESGARLGLHLPNLFILDGGKGQLSLLDELEQHYPIMKNLLKVVQFAALGKGEARKKARIGGKSKKSDQEVREKLYIWKEDKIQTFDLRYDEADRLLIKLRDEAHRFANYYRKQQERVAFKKAQEQLPKSQKGK